MLQSKHCETSGFKLFELGQPAQLEDWLISDWNAGQSDIISWSPENVVRQPDGVIAISLDEADAGSARAYEGGEIQSQSSSDTGTWSWLAEAPDMVDGAVFGMFLYKADWQNDPTLEFDFEFVGGDTTVVELNIHMETEAGEYVTLEGGPRLIELGFDAAEGMHLYEIEITMESAIFRIDGSVIAIFTEADMPESTWYSGEMKSFVDLWAVSPEQEDWAGEWIGTDEQLTGFIADLGTPDHPAGDQYIGPADILDPLWVCDLPAIKVVELGKEERVEILSASREPDEFSFIGTVQSDHRATRETDPSQKWGCGNTWSYASAGKDIFRFSNSEIGSLDTGKDLIDMSHTYSVAAGEQSYRSSYTSAAKVHTVDEGIALDSVCYENDLLIG